MNPFSVSSGETQRRKQNTCTLQSWARCVNTCSLEAVVKFRCMRTYSQAHSLLPAPHPIHSLPFPLPKRKDQALNPSKPHDCLAGERLSDWQSKSVGPHPHHQAKPVPWANSGCCCLFENSIQLETVKGKVLKTKLGFLSPCLNVKSQGGKLTLKLKVCFICNGKKCVVLFLVSNPLVFNHNSSWNWYLLLNYCTT